MFRMSPAPRIIWPKMSKVASGWQLRNGILDTQKWSNRGPLKGAVCLPPHLAFLSTLQNTIFPEFVSRDQQRPEQTAQRNWGHLLQATTWNKKPGTGHKLVMFTTRSAQRGKLLGKWRLVGLTSGKWDIPSLCSAIEWESASLSSPEVIQTASRRREISSPSHQ